MSTTSVSGKRLLMGGALVSALLLTGGLTWLWLFFHQRPTQEELLTYLEGAHEVDVIELKSGKPTRVVHLKQSVDWQWIVDGIKFKQAFWEFSDEPAESYLVQAIDAKGKRQLAFDVRADSACHLRKASRWYRMPNLNQQLHQLLKELVESKGRDVEAEFEEVKQKSKSGS